MQTGTQWKHYYAERTTYRAPELTENPKHPKTQKCWVKDP